MNTNTVIVDVQGFKDCKNNFIIKEFALATTEYTQTYLIKPPYTYSKLTSEERKQVNWIERNRGIYWREGYIDYHEFKRIIKPILAKKQVFVKGLEKVKWIKEICDDFLALDLSNKSCPNFEILHNTYCENNISLNCMSHIKQCALKNVLCLKKWCNDNKVM